MKSLLIMVVSFLSLPCKDLGHLIWIRRPREPYWGLQGQQPARISQGPYWKESPSVPDKSLKHYVKFHRLRHWKHCGSMAAWRRTMLFCKCKQISLTLTLNAQIQIRSHRLELLISRDWQS